MNQNRRLVLSSFVAVSALALAGTAHVALSAQTKETIPGVTNYTRVDATVACAGATTPEAVGKIKEMGFKSVINLRQASEPGANVEAEQAAVTGAGMKYIHLPFNGQAPDKGLVPQFLSAVADKANQPVFIHCASATRVGAMWAIKRVMQDSWAVDRALTEAEGIGLKAPALRQWVVDYLKEQGKS